MFENESPEQGGVSSWGVSQGDGPRGSAGAAAPDSDPRRTRLCSGGFQTCPKTYYRLSGITRYINDASDTPRMTRGLPGPANASVIESDAIVDKQSARYPM